MKKQTLLIILALLLLVTACSSKKQEEGVSPTTPEKIQFQALDRSGLTSDKVIAVYEGGEVNGEEFANYLAFRGMFNPMLAINDVEERKRLVQDHIFELIFGKDAQITPEIEEQAQGIWERQKMMVPEESLKEGYEKLGTTEEQLKKQLSQYLATEAAAQEHFKQQISEEEVQNLYNSVQEDVTSADVRHILISTHKPKGDGTLEEVRPDEEAKKLVDDVHHKLLAGADFAELAKEYSEDPGSKDNGGLYQAQPVSMWTEAFKKATLEQDIGEIGPPVKTEFGYHIIRVEERKLLSLEEVRDPLLNQLANEKFQAYFEQELPGLIKEINL